MAALDFTDREVLDALERCGGVLVGGALGFNADPELGTILMARLHEQTECLRRHGVEDFPLPIPSFAGVGSPYPINQIPWTDPALPGAVEACQAA
jgi:hypothetical protein